MRVVAGSARGLRLKGPIDSDIRPTTDKVREATFNALQSLGVLEGAKVLDLFAGTGACGIEALSRGAAEATFVDNNRNALDIVRQNLAHTKLVGTIVHSDVLRFVSEPRTYDIAIADPPYVFEEWPTLLSQLNCQFVVCESNRAIEPAEGMSEVRQRRYGTTYVTIFERAS